MDFKNYVGEVVTIKKVKVVMPVEVLASTLEEATEEINKRIKEDNCVRFGGNSSYSEGSRNEKLISTKVTVKITEAE
jgi:6-phosphogluconate dehydrogenase (decarboxylating)